jgi:uncharacterized protein
MMMVLNEILEIALAAAPWLLLGLFAAGLIKAFIPEDLLRRWVGGQGFAGIARAAVIGAPLPLCSCGAIPTGIALHRGGAGRGPTIAFMIGTPGIGMDSIAVTYALLGPFMAVARAAGAVVTAVATGLLVASARVRLPASAKPDTLCAESCRNDACASEPPASSAALAVLDEQLLPLGAPTRLLGAPTRPLGARLQEGMNFAFGDLLDDIKAWVVAGLVIAGVLLAFAPPAVMASYGSGLLPMLLMAVIGIPIYICATAATPIAAGMLLAGVSPGTALVFLLAGPITSMATLGVLRREMGNAALARYLLGILGTTVLLGILVDLSIEWARVDVVAQIGGVRELLPDWLGWAALATLLMVSVRPVRRSIGRLMPA